MLKQVFIFDNSYYKYNTAQLSAEGIKKTKEVMRMVKSMITKDAKIILIASPTSWIRESAEIAIRELGLDKFEVHPNYWSSYGGSGNDKRMANYLQDKAENADASVVILITEKRGIYDLSRYLRKFYDGMISAYRAINPQKGHLNFVGYANEKILKPRMRKLMVLQS